MFGIRETHLDLQLYWIDLMVPLIKPPVGKPFWSINFLARVIWKNDLQIKNALAYFKIITMTLIVTEFSNYYFVRSLS